MDEGVRFLTETGSVYVLTRTRQEMRWRRDSATLASGPLRNDCGALLWWPEAIELGQRCELWSEPIIAPWPRLVRTSRIVAFLDEPAEGAM